MDEIKILNSKNYNENITWSDLIMITPALLLAQYPTTAPLTFLYSAL